MSGKTDEHEHTDLADSNKEKEDVIQSRGPSKMIQKNHYSDGVTGNLNDGFKTQRKDRVNYKEMLSNVCFTSKIEPKNVNETVNDELWVNIMQEELVQFQGNEV